MIRGIYTASSGLISHNKTLDTAGNNIANARTAGYKSKQLITSTFEEQMVSRLAGDHPQSVSIGSMTMGRQVDSAYTSFQQGGLESTGRTLDFAIAGEGFFTIDNGSGSRAYTRSGQFTLDQAGFLCTAGGHKVLGQKGPVRVGSADLKINDAGEISLNNTVVDRLSLYLPADQKTLAVAGEGIFVDSVPNAGSGNFTGKIIQGSIEGSNVDMAKEMTTLMAASRGFQSCSQVIKMLDQISEKTVTEIGRL